MKVRLFRDNDGAWKNATRRQRALGLTLGLIVSFGPLVLVILILGLFATGRLN